MPEPFGSPTYVHFLNSINIYPIFIILTIPLPQADCNDTLCSYTFDIEEYDLSGGGNETETGIYKGSDSMFIAAQAFR